MTGARAVCRVASQFWHNEEGCDTVTVTAGLAARSRKHTAVHSNVAPPLQLASSQFSVI